MGKCWTFRGDKEIDTHLEKWTKQHEKSFHIRQALRQYVQRGTNYVQVEDVKIEEVEGEVELNLDDWS